MAAVIALASIGWGLHGYNQRMRADLESQAVLLHDQAERMIATGHVDEAESRYAALDALAARSALPRVRRLADDLHNVLVARRRLMLMRPVAPAVANASTPREGTPSPVAPTPALSSPIAAAPSISSAPQEPAREVKSEFDRTGGPYAVDGAKPQAAPPPAVTIPVHPRLPARHLTVASSGLTDEKIGASIQRGVDNLLQQFDPRTHLLFGAQNREGITMGQDVLCVYALMQAQQATNDPRLNPHEPMMKGLIDAMKSLDLNRYSYETYARGLRATALALYNRPEDRPMMMSDATVLVRGSHQGAYSYEPGRGRTNGLTARDYDDIWDNSNSQYGLLGVWAAAEQGFEVPDAYWLMVQNHWIKTENRNGTWGYHTSDSEGTHSMTCAGLASLFVTHDYLDAPSFGTSVGRDPFTPPLARGLKWLETGSNAVDLNRGGYDLYGLERVGLASGFKFFGSHEWYRELAAACVRDQFPDGGWGNAVETAYHLLFLARGRHPILMNKVRFDGAWANRPRDAANLARFVGYQLERPLNWQVVPIAGEWTDWMDSPILYLSSHKPVPLTVNQYEKIRTFVNNGGMLFMQADGGEPGFDAFAREAAHKLFPDYEMAPLPANHPLCTTVFKIKPDGKLFGVSNGSRLLMVYADEDLSKVWQQRDNKNRPFPFQFGTNLFIYAAGKRDLRNHLVSTYIPPVTATPDAVFRVARLKYAGNWNPEPAAWERFGRWFQLNTGYGLEVVETPIKDLKPETAPFAHLTGTARYDLTADEANAIKAYVESGGVLLVDLCGGTGAFDKSLQSSLYFKVFANTPPQVMPPTHPMLNPGPSGMGDLAHPVLRPYAIDVMGRVNGMGLPEEIVAGKGRVIFTSFDITSGLLGTTTWGILGYDPNYAQSLLKNAILWTVDGHPDSSRVAASR